MMRIKGLVGGRKVLIIGLSHDDLDRLRADSLDGFLKIDGDADQCEIWITSGPSEAAMFDCFRDGIGPNTTIHIDEKLKS